MRIIAARGCAITAAGTDSVVNASNNSATLGGGVSRALYEECGGKLLQDEMKAKLEDEFDGVLDEGDCLVTSAGSSNKFKYVLHVPAFDARGTKARLGQAGVEWIATSPSRIRACVVAALRHLSVLSVREGRARSIAFPLLGAGSGKVPVEASCHAMIEGIREFFHETPGASVGTIVFAVPEVDRLAVCSRLVRAAFGDGDSRA